MKNFHNAVHITVVSVLVMTAASTMAVRLATENFVTNRMAEALSGMNVAPIGVPESASKRGVTFVNQYGENENASVAVGREAVAGVVPEDLDAAPDNTRIRSGSVAIGVNAVARDPSNPYKQQGTAIGWNATAIGLNATAIGSGAVHTNRVPAESAEDPNSGAGNALAKGAKSVAIGYGAKAVANNAIQLGEGINNEADSLKFNNLTIAKGGKLNFSASDLSSAAKTAVSEMTGNRLTTLTQTIPTPTNGWAGVTVSSYDDGDGSDHLFSIMVNTNAAYSTTSMSIHGTRVDIYKKETIDAMLVSLLTTGLNINGTNYVVGGGLRHAGDAVTGGRSNG